MLFFCFFLNKKQYVVDVKNTFDNNKEGQFLVVTKDKGNKQITV